MKIAVIGTRGFPGLQGGIEKHCEELYTRMAKMKDIKFIIYRRVPYLNEHSKVHIENIDFIDLKVPRNKYFETFLHSFLSTIHVFFLKPDIAHFHNTGPGIFIPLLKLRRIKVVFTYHNISYTQKKWNSIAKKFLSLSEKISMKFSDSVIFISKPLQKYVSSRFNLPSQNLIYNGVRIPVPSNDISYIQSLGLEKRKYIISVGRFMEEKGFDYLIDAFQKAQLQDFKLVLVGDADYPTTYSTKLKQHAIQNNVILTGNITGENLNQIYSHAKLFVISSYSEGLPIVLLEALSFKLDILASNIEANKQIMISEDDFFKVGNVKDLTYKLKEKVLNKINRDYTIMLEQNFNWEKAAELTYEVFIKTLR
jgi:glycosyltransferase involved in cell wall biosynthesis